jgi:hypothetical protein
MATVQNSDTNISLTDTCVAAVVEAVFLLHVFHIPFTTHNAAFASGFPFTTHNATHSSRLNRSSMAVKVALILLCIVSVVMERLSCCGIAGKSSVHLLVHRLLLWSIYLVVTMATHIKEIAVRTLAGDAARA